MKKKKQLSVPEQPCPDYTFTMTKALADALRQKKIERHSKYDAFRFLVEWYGASIEEGPLAEPKPIAVTVSQLAEHWGWHRQTVLAMLEELQDLGFITMEKTRDGITLSFPKIAFDLVV